MQMSGKGRMTVFERLLSSQKVRKDSSGCWNWIAGKDSYGYGQMRVNGPKRLAHRISYEQHFGTIPEKMCVLHRCDNPACINPAHLFLGTQPENIADMIAKGRDRKARIKGEDHNQAKLIESEVVTIRASIGVPQTKLASLYGVSPSQIGSIRRRKAWSHIP